MKLFHLSLLFVILSSSSLKGSPNIVLILTDDHGWSQLSEYMDPGVESSRSDYLETPNLARLMNAGVRFTNGYSPAPHCTPTRRSILCGTSAARSGSEFKSPWIPADHLTIPKALKQANPDYRCAHFGKWGEQMISTPEEAGYDESDGETGNNTGGMPKTLGVKGSHGDGPPHFIDNEDPKRTRSMSDRTISFIKENVETGTPFYVQASYYAQHLSVVCQEDTLKKYEEKGTPDRAYPPAWAAMLEELDKGIGRILDTIDDLEIAGETYVFFTADNGGRGTVPGGDESLSAPNAPLTGAKHSLFEGGIRVPFFARGPEIPASSLSTIPVVGYDFLPTFFELAGGEGTPGDEIDGVSFARALVEPSLGTLADTERALVFHRPGKYESAIRKGEYKLRLTWQGNGVIRERELYHVAGNPTEEGNNVIQANQEIATALEKELVAYLESVDAEKPKKNLRNRKKSL
ncbi:MAG: sulfatase-like hydrolase/transferase [Verrucomicrobiales bacterium]|nr:sulfatase-like hydrolase/transferase [Verrucomicrobiales bacterium]